jgi:hypothetical protein
VPLLLHATSRSNGGAALLACPNGLSCWDCCILHPAVLLALLLQAQLALLWSCTRAALLEPGFVEDTVQFALLQVSKAGAQPVVVP